MLKYISKTYIYKVVFLLLLLSSVVHSYAPHTEYEVKGTYLLNFPRFIEPYSDYTNNTDLIIGVYGNPSFVPLLKKIARDANSPKYNWVFIEITDNTEILTSNSNFLFISGIEKTELIDILNITYGKKIITVGDNLPEFCELGGVINFLPQGHKKRFTINEAAYKEAGAIISSNLRMLAKNVSFKQDSLRIGQ